MSRRNVSCTALLLCVAFLCNTVLAADADPQTLKEYRKRLARIDKRDPAALTELGKWCAENKLRDNAIKLLKAALMEDSKFEPAIEQLKKLDAYDEPKPVGEPDKPDEPKTPPLSEGLGQVEEEIQSGGHKIALALIGRMLKDRKISAKEKAKLYWFRARCYEKAGEWRKARKAWEVAARPTAATKRDRAIAKARYNTLRKYPDGHYKPKRKPDEVAPDLDTDLLSDDKVIEAAMNDAAKLYMAKGEKSAAVVMKRAKSKPISRLRASFKTAISYFDQADLIVPDISKPSRDKLATDHAEFLMTPAKHYVTKALESTPINAMTGGTVEVRVLAGRMMLAGLTLQKWRKLEKVYNAYWKKAKPFIAKIKVISADNAEVLADTQAAVDRLDETINREDAKIAAIRQRYSIPLK